MSGDYRSNPYVGPVPFEKEKKDLFFGRESEAEMLLAKVISEKIVVFYAPSGAGKSSLLNARVVPRLEEKGYKVLPKVRVGGEIPPGKLLGEKDNVFLLNVLSSLNPARDFDELKKEDLISVLKSKELKAPEESRGRYLILDQFEELFTNHIEYWKKREGFFEHLRNAMESDSKLNLIFALREDYLAELSSYAHLMPDKLRVRFRMERLKYDSAVDAIKNPAKMRNCVYEDDLPEKLVDDLRKQKTDREAEVLGEFVEPVYLQIVCYQLWDNLKWDGVKQGEERTITSKDIESGNVTKALTQFYETGIAKVLQDSKETNIPGWKNPDAKEDELRRWFSYTLISPTRVRAQVSRGAKDSGGIPEGVVKLLIAQNLIRSEQARGGTWLELAHDRLIKPILDSNDKWFAPRVDALEAAAKLWADKNRDATYLYSGSTLANAQKIYSQKKDDFSDLVREFIDKSATRNTKIRTGVIGFLVLCLFITTGFGIYGMVQGNKAKKEAQIAKDERDKAEQEREKAIEATEEAEKKFQQAVEIITARDRVSPAQAKEIIQNDNAFKVYVKEVERQSDQPLPEGQIRLQYFAKDTDPPPVQNALKGLGFAYTRLLRVTQGATNTLWFGSDIRPEDVKRTASALIRAGIELRCIESREYIAGDSWKRRMQVGHDPNNANKPTLTEAIVQSFNNRTLCSR